jgi:hypothetical protein
MNSKPLPIALGAIALAAVLAGCGDSGVVPQVNASTKRAPSANFTPNVDAGWPVTPAAGPTAKQLSASKAYVARPDPFALLSVERSYETKQLAERVFSESGTFSVMITPPPERTAEESIVFEDQPYRRLAGVLVGDSVMAIIEMGDGQPPVIVRPGQMIPNSEWRVISIDEDKAVLRRAGRKMPREVTVRLESRPFGGGGGGGQGAGGPAGGPAGGGEGGGNPQGAQPGGGKGGLGSG